MARRISANDFDVRHVPVVGTPSEGSHFYFRQREGEERGNKTGCLPFGIDVRGHGGYVIAPKMILTDGGEYEFNGDFKNLMDAPVLPDWLAEILDAGKKETMPASPIIVTPQSVEN